MSDQKYIYNKCPPLGELITTVVYPDVIMYAPSDGGGILESCGQVFRGDIGYGRGIFVEVECGGGDRGRGCA